MFDVFMPLHQTDETAIEQSLGFDMYVGQEGFETGMYVRFDGGTPRGGAVTGLSFGGKGLRTGAMIDDEYVTLPTGTFAYLVPNPEENEDLPIVWQDTGVPVPTEQWFRVSYGFNADSEFWIDVNGAQIASGVALDAASPLLNTTSIDRLTFVRNMAGEGDGRRTPATIRWSPLAFDAPAPVGGEDAYHFYQITEDVTTAPGQSPLLVWNVHPNNGLPHVDMMGMPVTSPLRSSDYVALRNLDPNTGQPFAVQPVTFAWEAISPVDSTLIASGQWRAHSLPLSRGYYGEPAGGIAKGATPPYNGAPAYREILLGNYEVFGPTSVTPADVWYIDNLSFAQPTPPCTANLDNAGDNVNSGDLAVLLALWGSSDSRADLDGSGTVGSGDLAVLLAAWGACP